jgi:hypothetical protein
MIDDMLRQKLVNIAQSLDRSLAHRHCAKASRRNQADVRPKSRRLLIGSNISADARAA